VNITISVVALSVLVHGISARPLLARYERSLANAQNFAARERRSLARPSGTPRR
jgi:NhaP-type Na+/H+ or K+/H+ antiporter